MMGEMVRRSQIEKPSEDAPIVEWALYYAEMGIKVFPIQPRTKDEYYPDYEHRGKATKKHPKGTPYSWSAQATTDKDRIRKVFQKYPDANIGGCTGNGFYAVDIDERTTGSGFESIRKWEENGVLQSKLNLETWTSVTGSGGKQLFYYLSPEWVEKARNNHIDLAGDAGMVEPDSHIDTRGDGRYVVLPPSIHPNGERYRWADGKSLSDISIADFDRTVEYLFTHKGSKKKSRKNSIKHELSSGEKVPKGSRRAYMLSRVGELVNKMIDIADDSTIVAAAMQIANSDLDTTEPLDSGWDGLQRDIESMVYDFRNAILKAREEGNCIDWTYNVRAWYMEHPEEKLPNPVDWNEVNAAGDRRKKNEGESGKAVQSGADKGLYKLNDFLKYRQRAQHVYIVESKKDCEALVKLGHGFGCVTTAGSASDWKDEYSEYFKGLDVIILRDNDEAGIKYADKIKNSLKDYAHYVKIVKPSNLDHGGVTDYLTREGGTAQSLKEVCQAVTEVSFARWVKTDDKGKESGIFTGILAECIARNEKYIIVRNPKDDKDMFYAYTHGVYERKNKAEVKAMIREYIPESKVTDNMLNNTYNLLFATTEHIYNIEQLNSDSQYINFKNGLYDIGQRELKAHSPEVLSTIQFQFDYDPSNNNHPVFDKYIKDLCTKFDDRTDEDEIKIIQEYMGFLISNESMQKIKTALVLWSRLGNSGKSVLIRLISSLFGMDRVASIKLRELTVDNRFILGTLPECRLIVCGDESNSNVDDSSIFKSLTGGDPVKIEPKGKQGYSYIYRGGFVIACNGLPCFTDDKGEHLFNRLTIIPCEHHITEDIKDADLDRKLQNELPAIVNWMLEGLNRLIDNKFVFSKSKSSTMSKEEYRMQMDNVYRFIVENFVITHDKNDRYPRKAFNDQYHMWVSTSEGRVSEVKDKNLPARLEMLGVYSDYGNYQDSHHIAIYRGIKPLQKDSESIDWEDSGIESTLPFN